MIKLRAIVLALVLCVAFASLGLAAQTVILKNGKSYTGELRKLGGSYRMVLPDGTSHIIPAGEIVSIDGKPIGTDAPAAAAAGATDPKTPAMNANAGAAFKGVKAKADKVDAPVAAVQLWEDFIAANPDSPDIELAKNEKGIWDKLYKDNAERVKGKWLGGKELKDLKKKCSDLMKEAISKDDDGVNGIDGLRKLDQVIALYPNHFQANFYKGYYYLVQATRTNVGSQDALAKAMVSLERTAAIAPDAPEVWCNLAIGYNFKREYQKSIEAAYRAVKMRDDEDLVSILASALYYAPPQMRDVNPKVRKINEDAQVLFTRYKIGGPTGWRYIHPTKRADDKAPDESKRPPGVQWSGSGFFITADGYFLTNHHVATGDFEKPIDPALSFRVRLEDGSERSAELIAVGEKADVALMKIKTKPGEKLPFLPIAELNPNQGADAMVLGYPATGSEDMTMQISVGKVKSINLADVYHVWLDLNTTHGNSGGPIVDRHGRVIGILTAGRQSYNMTIVLGVGPDQIEVFLNELGSKIPWKPAYTPMPATGNDMPLNSELLTTKCRPATLLVLAINGDGKVSQGPTATKSGDEQPKGDKPDAPADGAGQ